MQQRSEATHQKILTSALDLFSSRGYDGTSVDQICEVSGISKGAFYHHFPEKHSLFLELLQIWLENLRSRLDKKIGDSSDLQHGLEDISNSIGEIITESRSKFPLILEFWRHSLSDPDLWRKAISPFYQYQDYFQNLMKNEFGDSLLDDDKAIDAKLMLAFSFGIVAAGIFDSQENWSRVASRGFDMIFHEISRREL